jgi:hypothetical protein
MPKGLYISADRETHHNKNLGSSYVCETFMNTHPNDGTDGKQFNSVKYVGLKTTVYPPQVHGSMCVNFSGAERRYEESPKGRLDYEYRFRDWLGVQLT